VDAGKTYLREGFIAHSAQDLERHADLRFKVDGPVTGQSPIAAGPRSQKSGCSAKCESPFSNSPYVDWTTGQSDKGILPRVVPGAMRVRQ
jgi:hypothetical protein